MLSSGLALGGVFFFGVGRCGLLRPGEAVDDRCPEPLGKMVKYGEDSICFFVTERVVFIGGGAMVANAPLGLKKTAFVSEPLSALL